MRTEPKMDKNLASARPPSGEPAASPTPMQRFAAELAETLGLEQAISACRENNWHGVLKEIRKIANGAS